MRREVSMQERVIQSEGWGDVADCEEALMLQPMIALRDLNVQK
jgi:hypothetical protein